MPSLLLRFHWSRQFSATSCVHLCREEALNDREERLWQRQDVVWRQEHQRWELERLRWDAKESTLQNQISELQDKILSLSTAQSSQASYSQRSPPQDLQSAQAQREREGSDGYATESTIPRDKGVESQNSSRSSPRSEIRYPPTNSVTDEAAQFLPSDDDGFKPPSREDFMPLQVPTQSTYAPNNSKLKGWISSCCCSPSEGGSQPAL